MSRKKKGAHSSTSERGRTPSSNLPENNAHELTKPHDSKAPGSAPASTHLSLLSLALLAFSSAVSRRVTTKSISVCTVNPMTFSLKGRASRHGCRLKRRRVWFD